MKRFNLFIKKLLYILYGYYKLIIKSITRTPSKFALERLKICNTCKYNKHGICSKCGCLLKAKVEVDFILDKNGISIDGCPEKKW